MCVSVSAVISMDFKSSYMFSLLIDFDIAGDKHVVLDRFIASTAASGTGEAGGQCVWNERICE